MPKDQPNKGTAININGYSGEIFFGLNQFYVEPGRVRIRHSGAEKLNLFLLANQSVALTPDDKSMPLDGGVDDNLSTSDLARIAVAPL